MGLGRGTLPCVVGGWVRAPYLDPDRPGCTTARGRLSRSDRRPRGLAGPFGAAGSSGPQTASSGRVCSGRMAAGTGDPPDSAVGGYRGSGCMIGRYLIYTPAESAPDEKVFDAVWQKFAWLCRSLHRDGLSYDVQFNLTAPRPHVLITATGTAKHRPQAVPSHTEAGKRV